MGAVGFAPDDGHELAITLQPKSKILLNVSDK